MKPFLKFNVLLCCFSVFITGNSYAVDPMLNIYSGIPPEEKCGKQVELAIESKNKEYIYNSLMIKGGDKYISSKNSKISIWETKPEYVLGCRKSSDWIKYSDIMPGDGTYVVTFASKKCHLNQGNEYKDAQAHILIEEKLGNIEDSGTETVDRYFYSLKGWHENPANRSKKTYNNYRVGSYAYHNYSTCIVLKNK